MRAAAVVAVLTWSSLAAAAEPAGTLAGEPWVWERFARSARFEDDGTGRARLEARVRVNADAGAQAFSTISYTYRHGAERLELVVRVVKPDGRVLVVAPEAFHEITAPVAREAPVYSDVRELQAQVPDLKPGDVLEWEATRQILTPQLAGHFWYQHRGQPAAVVLDEGVELDVPRARPLTVRTGAPFGEPAVEEAGDRRIYRWHATRTDLAAISRTRDARTRARTAGLPTPGALPEIEVTTFRTWAEFGALLDGLMRPRAAVTSELRARAEAAVRGAGSDREKVRRLYELVSRDVRYVGLELGQGAFLPRPAAETLATGYGDCKDKHTLLAAMLGAVGLEASPVIVGTEGLLGDGAPGPVAADHVITQVRLGGETLWFDATALAPAGWLAPVLRGHKGLLLAGERSRLVELPAAPAVPNDGLVDLTRTIDAAGDWTGRLHLAARGDGEVGLRSLYRRLPTSQATAGSDGLLKALGQAATATSARWSDPGDLAGPFTVDIDFKSTKPFEAGRRWSLNAPSALLRLPPALEGEPVRLGGPHTVLVRFTVEVPAGRALRAPEATRVERDFAEYHDTFHVVGQTVVAEHVLAMRLAELPAARAGEYLAFRAEVEKALARQVVAELPPAGAADPEVERLFAAAIAAHKERHLEEAARLYRKVVERAPRHPKAWGSLGFELVELHRPEEAEAALRRQLELDPKNGNAHNNLGRALRQLHRDDEAEAAFRAQVAAGGDVRFAQANLGYLLLDRGRPIEAAAALEQAVALAPKEVEQRLKLGRAWLEAKEDAKGLAALQEAVRLSPTTGTWNDAAYFLAVRGVHLDEALRWAESAVASGAARLTSISPERAAPEDAVATRLLVNAWDTLGWVRSARGELEPAAALVAAAWEAGRATTIAEHLATIRKAQGRAVEAASATSLPVTGAGAEGEAEFLVVTGPDGLVEAVRFQRGDEPLRAAEAAVRAAVPPFPFPEGRASRLVRWARLACTASGCALELPGRLRK